MRILHVVASINKNVGGPAYSVSRLVNALAERKIIVSLASLDYPEHGEQHPLQCSNHLQVRVSAPGRFFRGRSPALLRLIEQEAEKGCDLIHNHGLWMYPNYYARYISSTYSIPLVTSPRGMMESWSLKKNRSKKRIAWWLRERKNIRSATAFHATSSQEAQSLRKCEVRQPIAVIPNGVDPPEGLEQFTRGVIEEDFPECRSKRWIVFLSRIDPKKGLDHLLRVWGKLSAHHSDWHLLIAGPDLLGWKSELLRLRDELGISDSISFTGMMQGERKGALLACADLFVLPTHSENFGIVIAEALAHATPVITTQEAPWGELLEANCGWWVPDSIDTLEKALSEALAKPSSELGAMGLAGRQLVRERYAWSSIAEQMEEFYSWLLNGASEPRCVVGN